MTATNSNSTVSPTRPSLGGVAAVSLFAVVLAAYVAQSQLTQYIQGSSGYRQPYLLFYIAHSSFTVIFPLHLFYLHRSTGQPVVAYLHGLRGVITEQLLPSTGVTMSPDHHHPIPLRRLFCMSLALTCGVTCPALLWYASVSLTSISNVTTLFNTNAFWAYILSIALSRSKWELTKLVAVLLACTGVFVVVREDDVAASNSDSSTGNGQSTPGGTSPFLGNALILVASFTYGLYQVLYKKYVALSAPTSIQASSRHTASTSAYSRIPSNPDTEAFGSADGDTDTDLLNTIPDPLSDSPHSVSYLALDANSIQPIQPPFGFHPNFFTSCIGLCTLLIFWIPIPILHILDIEPFQLPSDFATVLGVLAIVTSGLIFNAGFMILLGIWGPVLTSVGNLLTIVLVMISDVIFGDGYTTITFHGVIGSGMIICAFAVLVWDMSK